MIRPAHSLLIALTATIGLTLAAAAPATAQTKLKVVLNWKYQGPQGMFFLAEDVYKRQAACRIERARATSST